MSIKKICLQILQIIVSYDKNDWGEIVQEDNKLFKIFFNCFLSDIPEVQEICYNAISNIIVDYP